MIEYQAYISEEQYPSTIVLFPHEGEPELVKLSAQFGVWSEDDGYILDYYDTEEEADDAVDEARNEAGEADDVESSRFWVERAPDWDELPAWFTELEVEEHFVRQDAWRGYTEVRFLAEEHGWVKLASGWVTGYPDDTVRHKLTASDLYRRLYEDGLRPAVDIIWTFSTSSNVFSTISDIWVRERDLEALKAWLPTVGFDPEDVELAFH